MNYGDTVAIGFENLSISERPVQAMATQRLDNERRLVMIGKTGSGKSSSCNNIVGDRSFKSESSSVSITRVCQRGKCQRFGRDIQIIDTPGLFDTGMTNGETTREIVKCIGISAPGPHAFIFIIPIGRFTKEEEDTVAHFKHVFGKDMLKHFLILFTKKDELAYDGKSIQQYLQTAPKGLKDLLESCNNRYIAFNNRGSPEERERDVQDLMNLIDSIYLNNGGRCYTSDMYQEAEKIMKKREAELKREHEAKVNREKMMMQQEFDKKMKLMESQQAEKIAKLQEEIKKREADKEKQHEQERMKLELEKEKLKMEKELELEKRRMENEAHKRQLENERIAAQNHRDRAREDVSKGGEAAMGMLKLIAPFVANAVMSYGMEQIKNTMSAKSEPEVSIKAETKTTDVKKSDTEKETKDTT